MRNEFTFVFELIDDERPELGYFAYCPEIREARAEGESIEVCQALLVDSVKAALAARREKSLRDVPKDAIIETIVVG